MSFDVCDDIATYLEELDYGQAGVDIFTQAQYRQMGELRGILVEAPSPGDIPDVLTESDVIPVEITVCKGEGDKGRYDTGNLAFRIYRALDLLTDIEINGTLYMCITAETVPYEVERDGRYYRMMRFDVTRYYGGITVEDYT